MASPNAHTRGVSRRPFSKAWVLASMAVFIGVELAVSAVVGHALLKNALSIPLSFTLQGLLHASSYFLGGLLIGIISPKQRIAEPAAGAFCAVLLMFLLTSFMPTVFFRMDGSKIIVGGLMALGLALAGARLGERWTGNLD